MKEGGREGVGGGRAADLDKYTLRERWQLGWFVRVEEDVSV